MALATPIDTPTSGNFTRMDLAQALSYALGVKVPETCWRHPTARPSKTIIDQGRILLVTFDCECRIPVVQPKVERDRHYWRS